jgi:hypothetical protein
MACEHGRVSTHNANPFYELVQWWRIYRSDRRQQSPKPVLEDLLANATTEEEVRDAVRDHNESAAQYVSRSRYAGPAPLLEVEDVLAQWRARRQDSR